MDEELNIEPFDPKKHEPIDTLLNYGGKSDVIVAVDLLYTMANN